MLNDAPLLEFVLKHKLPRLPTTLIDRDGRKLEVRNGLPVLGPHVRHASLGQSAPPILRYALVRWLIHRGKTCARATLRGDLGFARELTEHSSWVSDPSDVRLVRDCLKRHITGMLHARRARDKARGQGRLERMVDQFRGWYGWCVKENLPGFDPEFSEVLLAYRVPPRKNGKAVMSWDPSKGPLTRLEELQFRQTLLKDKGPIDERLICWLVYGMGLRPRQIILLIERDFHVYVAANGDRFYHLDVPRVKKKGMRSRSQLKRRKIGAQLGELIEEMLLCRRVGKRSPPNPDAPLFQREVIDIEGVKPSVLSEEWWRQSRPEGFITQSLRRLVERNKLISVRTRKLLKASPRRLRYTFATNKAEMLEPSVLAELLDHSDIRSVLVYYNAREGIAAELGRKLGKSTGPSGYRTVMEAFAGIPICVTPRQETEKLGPAATRFIPHEMVSENMSDLPGIGSCGGKYKCGTAPIVSCYTCDDYIPWQEADHKAVATWLESEINKLRSDPQTAEATLHDFELALINANRIVAEQRALAS